MPRRSFAQFLLGSASLERPAFFYAYAGMWLHLLIGLPLLFYFGRVGLLDTLGSMVIGSLSLGIVVYSLLAREYGLLPNLGAYVIAMLRVLQPQSVEPILLLIAIILSLSSGYLLLSSEYRRYSKEVFGDEQGGISLWFTVLMGLSLISLFIYGIGLL